MASYTDPPEEDRPRREFTVAGIFVVLAVITLYLPAGIQNQVSAGLQATILRPFLMTKEALGRSRLRAEDALFLNAQLDSLAGVIVGRAPLAQENRHLQDLLGLVEKAPTIFVAANAFRSGTAGSESMFLLDAGSDQGIQQGDPVLVRSGSIGLVGVIQQVRGGISIGSDWSHPEFRASAMSEDGVVYGFVRTGRGVFREEDRLFMDGIPFHEELEVGTLITTSGLGGIFPRGVPIGEVDALRGAEERWSRSYWLRPVVATGSITHVLVAVGGGLTDEAMELLLGKEEISPDSLSGGESSPGSDDGGTGA